ncbi:Uncharacterised protein [Mycobacterium tuberculosis]|nr:Uncharacterised protein [Mycobacterium tuberculosis]
MLTTAMRNSGSEVKRFLKLSNLTNVACVNKSHF